MAEGKLNNWYHHKRPYRYLHSDARESAIFCLKGDLPYGVIDGVTLQFDAIPSFDKKKNQESWKAVNIRTMRPLD